jgi:membrane protein
MTSRVSGQLGGAAGTFTEAANFLVSFALMTALFALMFKYLPDAKIRWNEVWTGAIITALLFVVGKFALGFYLGRKNLGSTYGAAGSLALIMLWIYYSGLIFLYGAEFTQARAKIRGHRILPASGAVRVLQVERIEEPSRDEANSARPSSR